MTSSKENHHSIAMRLCRALGLKRLAWSLRRLHCPVDRSALVLEVGSGGNPYLRANVLLDAFEATQQRHWVPLVSDRPTVLGLAERLPFRDKAFDFVIASHVLEHSADPQAFLSELQRVGRAGYIEVPDAFMERLNPYHDHRLEITDRDGTLLIRKKASWQPNPDLTELYEARAKAVVTRETIPQHPFDFHVRFFWSDAIPSIILNPEVDASWVAPDYPEKPQTKGARAVVQQAVLVILRALFSQTRRNSRLSLVDLLRCAGCGGVRLSRAKSVIHCPDCGADYPVKNGIPVMFPPGTE